MTTVHQTWQDTQAAKELILRILKEGPASIIELQQIAGFDSSYRHTTMGINNAVLELLELRQIVRNGVQDFILRPVKS